MGKLNSLQVVEKPIFQMTNNELRLAIQSTVVQMNECYLRPELKQILKDHLLGLLGAEKQRSLLMVIEETKP